MSGGASPLRTLVALLPPRTLEKVEHGGGNKRQSADFITARMSFQHESSKQSCFGFNWMSNSWTVAPAASPYVELYSVVSCRSGVKIHQSVALCSCQQINEVMLFAAHRRRLRTEDVSMFVGDLDVRLDFRRCL